MTAGYNCQTPEVPMAYKGRWEDWGGTISKLDINDNTILIGHSCGCGAFLKYIAQNQTIKLDKLILVAPYIDPDKDYGDLLNFELDSNLFNQVNSIHLIKSDDEPLASVNKTTAMLKQAYPDLQYTEVKGYGHCTLFAMQTEEFPELLEVVKK